MAVMCISSCCHDYHCRMTSIAFCPVTAVPPRRGVWPVTGADHHNFSRTCFPHPVPSFAISPDLDFHFTVQHRHWVPRPPYFPVKKSTCSVSLSAPTPPSAVLVQVSASAPHHPAPYWFLRKNNTAAATAFRPGINDAPISAVPWLPPAVDTVSPRHTRYNMNHCPGGNDSSQSGSKAGIRRCWSLPAIRPDTSPSFIRRRNPWGVVSPAHVCLPPLFLMLRLMRFQIVVNPS
ncbi:hypothetical protein KCP69_19075 [Salmonella enterica subsp. enterica]|nr:hypothetical protein KCP69_19075 [Salmonella enterica subsp. enterica]